MSLNTILYTHQVHIGDQVWVFDINSRHYEKDANGRNTGSPIWRKHWVDRMIVGETARNWLIGFEVGRTHTKAYGGRTIPKHEARAVKELPPGIAWTQGDIDTIRACDRAYHHANAALLRCPAETFMAIAKMLGVKT